MVERESREIVIDVVLELANLSVGGKVEEVCMIGLCLHDQVGGIVRNPRTIWDF